MWWNFEIGQISGLESKWPNTNLYHLNFLLCFIIEKIDLLFEKLFYRSNVFLIWRVATKCFLGKVSKICPPPDWEYLAPVKIPQLNSMAGSKTEDEALLRRQSVEISSAPSKQSTKPSQYFSLEMQAGSLQKNPWQPKEYQTVHACGHWIQKALTFFS